jgi:hypothetical protein
MITSCDKETLKTIYRQLVPMPASEGCFTGMENLFYSALQLARNYGSDQMQNALLRDFIEVKENRYSETQKPYHKQQQRELTIFHFKRAFKKKLGTWIK